MDSRAFISKPNVHSTNCSLSTTVPKGSFTLSGIMLAVYVFTIVAWSQVSAESATHSKLVGIALTAVFAAEFLMYRQKEIRFPKAIVILGLFLLWNVTSYFWAQNSDAAITTITTLLQLWVFSVVTTNILVQRISLMPAMLGFLAGLIWAVFEAFKANDYGFVQDTDVRFGSLLVNPNLYAIALIIGILFCLYLYRYTKKHVKLLLLGIVFLAVQQVYFFAGSRKGMLATVFIFVVYLGITSVLKSQRAPQYLILLVAGSIITLFTTDWLIANSPYSERLLNYQTEASFQVRERLINFGLEKWDQKPILGYGTNQYRVLLINENGIDTYSHNNYVELLMNSGLIGIAIYYGFYLQLFINYWRLYSSKMLSISEFAWGLTILSLFVLMDYGLVSYFEKIYWVVFSILIAHQVTMQHQTPISNSLN